MSFDKNKCEACGAGWGLGDSQWISLKDRLPDIVEQLLVTDGERQWVAMLYNGVWLACHPDYDRTPHNDFGAPYLVFSQPAYWMPLPAMPPREDRHEN